jgi:deoxyadenosine/deoxycytidine kinase
VGGYVVVEGLIGVGKTSLCHLLADAWGARLVLEPSETNPFLGPFYEDPARYAFPVQMYYLMTRWRQQEVIRQQDLFHGTIVSDYLFEKDRLFAEKTLEPLELDLYDRFAAALGEQAPSPDLVVFLTAPIPVLMERIAGRHAAGEDRITPDYLEDLAARYERLLTGWDRSPILRLDNRALDYVGDPHARQVVLRRVESALRGEETRDRADDDRQASLFPGS